jgi:hypothetical protein
MEGSSRFRTELSSDTYHREQLRRIEKWIGYVPLIFKQLNYIIRSSGIVLRGMWRGSLGLMLLLLLLLFGRCER